MRQLESRARKALEIYHMIEEGDRVAVGVSGGKDSVALLYTLAALRRYYPKSFTLTAFTLDPCFGGVQTDYGPIEALCRELSVPYYIRRTDLGEIIFETRKEKNPCSLCARTRRGALHDLCVAHNCNKLALGHHMDDAVETFFLNLFYEGRIGAFSPVTYLSRKDITVIRPLILCTESDIVNAVRRAELPAVKSLCPRDGVSERQRMKEFIAAQEREHPGFLTRTFTALTRAHISGL